MRRNMLLESIERELRMDVPVRRYSLADMISESYRTIYQCGDGTNLKRLAESHLEDVKKNPRDIERLSRQLAIIKELNKMVESEQLKDEDLVDKKDYDEVEPKEDRVIVKHECNESAEGYTWSGMGWHGVPGDKHHTNEYYMDEDHQSGTVYAPDDVAMDEEDEKGYAATINASDSEGYDLVKASPVFKTEEEAKKWVENYFRQTESEHPVPDYDDEETTEHKDRIGYDGSAEMPMKLDHPFAKSQKKVTESDEPDLTDEELEELAKHLETIRKERKNAPKTEMKEADEPEAPKRRGIRCRLADSKKEDLEEAAPKVKVDIYIDGEFNRTKYFDDMKTAQKWADQFNYDGGINDTATDPELVDEAKIYSGLENFKKVSESKAFYKTFKKMHETLKEGKALTRQESIDLYKASNSALTQLSIELEHNPEFLDTFKESVSVLSADVNSLLESLTRGKAPSKKTMQSLAKFSGVLLDESEDLHRDGNYTVYRDDDGNLKARDNRTGDDVDFDMEELIGTGRVKVNEADEEDDDEDLDDIEASEEDIPAEDTEVEEEAPEVEEAPEEDFVGDDEGDVQSEEADAFDQEYADARVELHKEMEVEHADDEDPAVQDKIEQDKEEVLSLDGITDEQIEELTGESSEEGEEEDVPEEPTEGEPTEEEESEEDPIEAEDDSEITDDELAELKKHLTEMRAARRLEEARQSEDFSAVVDGETVPVSEQEIIDEFSQGTWDQAVRGIVSGHFKDGELPIEWTLGQLVSAVARNKSGGKKVSSMKLVNPNLFPSAIEDLQQRVGKALLPPAGYGR